jgi:quercetin dioxygenase-like cupin family protein
MTRRDLASLLPLLGLPAAAAAADSETAHSKAFLFGELPVHRSPKGNISRPVIRGTLATGEAIEIHETTLMPGQMPHPAHKHAHSEFMMIREGTVEFLMEGHSKQVGPGGVLYAASNEMHGLKNVGWIPANYFVIAIGHES